MPPVVVTSDNIGAALTQLAERQDEQAAAIELLAEQLADQSVHSEEQDEALRVQAAALRVTAAQLSRNIADTAKAANGSNGTRATGDRSANRAADTNGDGADSDDADRDDDSGISDERVTPIRRGTTARSAANGVTKPAETKAKPPAEPAAPERKRAHRWI